MTDAPFLLNTQMLYSGATSQLSQPSPRIPVRKSRPRSRRWFERPTAPRTSPVSTPAPRVTDHFPVGVPKKPFKSAPVTVTQNTPSKSAARARGRDTIARPVNDFRRATLSSWQDAPQNAVPAVQQPTSGTPPAPPSPAPRAARSCKPPQVPLAKQAHPADAPPRPQEVSQTTDKPGGRQSRRTTVTEPAKPKVTAKQSRGKAGKTKKTGKKGNARKPRNPSPCPPLALQGPEDGEWDEHGLSWKAPPAPATPPVSQVLAMQLEASEHDERHNGNGVPSEIEEYELLYQEIGEQHDQEAIAGEDPILCPNSGSSLDSQSDLENAQQAYEPMMFPENDVLSASQVGADLDADDFDEGSPADYGFFDEGSVLHEGYHDGDTELDSSLAELRPCPKKGGARSNPLSSLQGLQDCQVLQPIPCASEQSWSPPSDRPPDSLLSPASMYPYDAPTQLNSPPSLPPLPPPRVRRARPDTPDDPSTSSKFGLALFGDPHVSERSSDMRPPLIPGRRSPQPKKPKKTRTYSKKQPYVRQQRRSDDAPLEPVFSQTVCNPQPPRTTRSRARLAAETVDESAAADPTASWPEDDPPRRYESEGESELEDRTPIKPKKHARPRQAKVRKTAKRPSHDLAEHPVPDEYQPITQLFTIQQDNRNESDAESEELMEILQSSRPLGARKPKRYDRLQRLDVNRVEVPALRMQENVTGDGDDLDKYLEVLNKVPWRKGRVVIPPPRRTRKNQSSSRAVPLSVGRTIERIPFEEVKKMYHPSQPGRDVSNAQKLIRAGLTEQRNQELAALRKRTTSKKRSHPVSRLWGDDELVENVEQFAPSPAKPNHPPNRGVATLPPAPRQLPFTRADPPPVHAARTSTIAAYRPQEQTTAAQEVTGFQPHPASPNEILGPPRIGYKDRRDKRKVPPGATEATYIDLTEMVDLRPTQPSADSPMLVIDEQGYLQKRKERREASQPLLMTSQPEQQDFAKTPARPATPATPVPPAIPELPEMDAAEALQQLAEFSMSLSQSHAGLKPGADPMVTMAPEPLIQEMESRSSRRQAPLELSDDSTTQPHEKRSDPSETTRLFGQYLDFDAIPSPMTSASNRPPATIVPSGGNKSPADRSRYINMSGIEDYRVRVTGEILATAGAARRQEPGSTSSKRKRLREREERVRANRQAQHAMHRAIGDVSEEPERTLMNAASQMDSGNPHQIAQAKTESLAVEQQSQKKWRLGTRGIGHDKTAEAFAPFKPLTQTSQGVQDSQPLKPMSNAQTTLAGVATHASFQSTHGSQAQPFLVPLREPATEIRTGQTSRALSQEYNRTFALLQERCRRRQQDQGRVLLPAAPTCWP